MSTNQGFEVVRHGAIATLWLDRPDAGNRLSNPMIAGLAEAVRSFASEPDVALIALRGRGRDFCLGRDPGQDPRHDLTPYEIRTRVHGLITSAYEALRSTPVPVAAVVSGRAAGFGAALASACDIVIAAESATFALPEIEQGFPPTLAMSTLIAKVPPKALTYLVLDGQPISATHALTIGLVSTLIADDVFATGADEHLARLASRPRVAAETIKLFMREGAAVGAGALPDFASLLLALARTARR